MALLPSWPSGIVATNNWLEEHGINRFLKRTYLRSGWLESLGTGACVKGGDHVSWEGGLYALQHYLKKNIHVGGKTAISLLGLSHNVTMAENEAFLFTLVQV